MRKISEKAIKSMWKITDYCRKRPNLKKNHENHVEYREKKSKYADNIEENY